MSKAPNPQRITITVTGGFVDSVYTTLSLDVEVDILDFDNAERESPEAAADTNAYLNEAIQEQQKIY